MALDDKFLHLQELSLKDPAVRFEFSKSAKRRGIDSSPRALATANRNNDAEQVKADMSSAPRVCRPSTLAASSTPPTTAMYRRCA